MTEENTATPPLSLLREKVRNIVSEVVLQDHSPEPEAPAVWSNAAEMFASEFA